MKRIIATFAALAALIPAFSQEVWEISPKDYEISNSDLRKAKEIILKSATIIQYTIKGRFMSR